MRRVRRSDSLMMRPRKRWRSAGVEVRVVVQDLGERADRGERRAQLVRHRGDEVVLEPVELLQALVGGLQARGGRLQLALLVLELVAVGDHLRGLVDDRHHLVEAQRALPARRWPPSACAEAAPMVPASCSSAKCTSSASASSSSTDLRPRARGVGEEELGGARRGRGSAPAASAARKPRSSPRHSMPRSPVCVKTSTKSVAWLCSTGALPAQQASRTTKAPMLAIMLQIIAWVIWSRPGQPEELRGLEQRRCRTGPCSTTATPNQPDLANAGSSSV